MKKTIAAVLAAVFLLCACGAAPSEEELPGVGGSTVRSAVTSGELQFSAPGAEAVYATVETTKGTVRFVLYPKQAPLAVENFCALAEAGYYSGTALHRIVHGFVVQGGDTTATGGAGKSVWGTPFGTERSDQLHHYSGALCMAPADGQANTHESQFYVVATEQDSVDEAMVEKMRSAGWREGIIETYLQAGGAPYLDYTATVFGQVVEGMDVIDAMARVPVEEDGTPKTAITILSVTIQNYTPLSGQLAPASQPGSSVPVGSSDPLSTL